METQLATIDNKIKEKFELICLDAQGLAIVQNAGSAFKAVQIVKSLRDILTEEVMRDVFMPLMNTKVGFLTDRTGKPNKQGTTYPIYSIAVVRDAIVDAICFGVLPVFNQMNIISERFYPTKEGFSALLKKWQIKNILEIGVDISKSQFVAEIPVKITYEYKGEKNSFSIIATVKKDSYSSSDQIRGKAERRAKKQLFEYVTGCDFGDADETSSIVDIATIKTPLEKKQDIKIKQVGQQNKIDLP